MFLARIYITLKPTVNDPQGLTVKGGLHTLGFNNVKSVRVGKYMEVRIDAGDAAGAGEQVNEMCRKLLANPVIAIATLLLRGPVTFAEEPAIVYGEGRFVAVGTDSIATSTDGTNKRSNVLNTTTDKILMATSKRNMKKNWTDFIPISIYYK